MKFKFSSLIALLLLFVCSSMTIPPTKSNRLYVTDYENVLGTSLEIKIASVSSDNAKASEDKAMNVIDRMNKILSAYDAESEFSQWLHTNNKAIKVSPELFEVLSLFDKWRTQSGGALDASAEVVSEVWKDAAKRNEQPTPAELASAVAKVKQTHWQLSYTNGTATHLDDAPLMLNSFVKSYIMNKACDAAMASAGTTGIVLNIGGDIVVRGKHTEQIAISDPKADAENDDPVSTLIISNKTVATSGNYRRGEMVNGLWHSHIVDPRTGMPADQITSATVVADNPTDAGALATAFNVLTPTESKTLAASVPNAEYMIITSGGERIESKGWKKLERVYATTAAAPATLKADKTWDPAYVLKINVELAQIEGMRVHRPYLAVWIADKDKKPVKSIALWYNKTKFLDEMPSWYDAYYNKISNADQSVTSTTSATRSAGNYTLKWDGKNDKGELVKLGTYAIMVEVAREHGTHQLMTQEIDFTKAPKTPIALTGNVEVKSASFEYVKKD